MASMNRRGDLKEAVESFLQRKKGNVQLKYTSLDFKCRYPQPLSEGELLSNTCASPDDVMI